MLPLSPLSQLLLLEPPLLHKAKPPLDGNFFFCHRQPLFGNSSLVNYLGLKSLRHPHGVEVCNLRSDVAMDHIMPRP
ncbi:hypothetical protein GBA52_028329 [Prunus armeniaca]|nr:hypothetical protein GBA52_028329 [Prunus armeniaca]